MRATWTTREEDSGGLQDPAAVGVPRKAGTSTGASTQLAEVQRRRLQDRFRQLSRLPAAILPGGGAREGLACQVRQHRDRAREEIRFQGSLSGTQGCCRSRDQGGLLKGVEKQRDAIGKEINGWRIGSAFGDRAFYNGNYVLRAGAALAGIYGNGAVEAMYPLAKNDGEGQPLDGSKHDYTLTFAKDQFAPVNTFWSVTMYVGKTQLLIDNPINRSLINSPMLPAMKTNSDGSLTLHIQNESPGKAKQANWLPAPDRPIYMVMRLYWPKDTPPSILPPVEGTWKPPAVIATK